ncbi:MAG: hypothetical protein Q9162_006785 [Coniocarpon cinnabarinum]
MAILLEASADMVHGYTRNSTMSTIRERVYGPISQAPPKYFYIYFKSLKSKGAIESLRIQRRQHHFIRKLMRNALWGETYTRITFDGDGSRALVEAPYADGWQRALSRNPTKLLTDNGWKFFAGEEYPRFEPKDWDMTPVEIDQGGVELDLGCWGCFEDHYERTYEVLHLANHGRPGPLMWERTRG